tara:strand:+ start:6773 stop:7051 length:279 start_codon:yes stop_codon:yes gene_type:complete
VGSAVFEINREKPLNANDFQKTVDAIVEGKNLCLNAPIETDPYTYLCINTGGMGFEHGFSYGNGILLLLSYWLVTLLQYMYILNKIHKSLRI